MVSTSCSYLCHSHHYSVLSLDRYGDVTPTTDEGKIAVAMYTILVSNVIGGLLQPARSYLESLCQKHVKEE